MDSDDTRRDLGTAVREERNLGPHEAFNRAMVQHQLAAVALAAAIRRCDVKAVEVAAGAAFTFWLAARAVLRRLESAERAELPSRKAMRYALHTNRRALLDVFTRAEQQLASPGLDFGLGQLRSSLALADDAALAAGGGGTK